MRSVLVTGGNQGIGYALCRQLAIDHQCHVFLTARNVGRGQEAANKIASLIDSSGSKGSIDFIPLDTSDEKSIRDAAGLAREKLSKNNDKLYGIVNNAGIGLNTGNSGDILTTNLYGPKRVVDEFLDVLDPNGGRIVNLGSGSGPMYVGSCRSVEDRRMLCGPDAPDLTFERLVEHARANLNGSDAYGLSKALLACYTGILATRHPNIVSSCVSPGFVDTQMTAGWGASKTPDEGTFPIKKCLFEELDGNGWYYGSDGLRSPYHFMRNPGEPTYDGVNPFM